MNELVRLTTQDVGSAIPITDSWVIAEEIGDEHWRIKRLIESHLDDFNSFGRVNFQSCTIDTNGGMQEVEIAILTEEHFLFLITLFRVKKNKKTTTEKEIKMQERNKKVIELKKELVRQFTMMKKELTARIQTRHIGIIARKNLTDTIKKCVTDEGNFKNWAYSTYSKLVYKKILGKDVKKAKLERNVKDNENIRDYLTIEELEKVQELESKIATFIEFTDTGNMTDKEVYALVKQHIEK